jgi:subtilase family serine protease
VFAKYPGVTFVASSGDSGAPASWPAISPSVLAIGGTTATFDSAGNYQSEIGWSGSGGGVSPYFGQPAYQAAVVPTAMSSPNGTAKRTNPDVAYGADPGTTSTPTGFAVFDSVRYYPYYPFPFFSVVPNWTGVGGTSAGSPQWAALTALANQQRGASLGQQAMQALYNAPSSDFHDITSGSNKSGDPLYSAVTGYDMVTGRGSPQAAALVPYLASYSSGGGSGQIQFVSRGSAGGNAVRPPTVVVSGPTFGPADSAALTLVLGTDQPPATSVPTPGELNQGVALDHTFAPAAGEDDPVLRQRRAKRLFADDDLFGPEV